MLKNDFVDKLLNELYITLSDVEKMKKNKSYKEAMKCIDNGFKQFLGLRPETVNLLSYKDLIEIISSGGNLSIEKGIILAELLNAKGDLYKLNGEEHKAVVIHIRSLDIFLETLLMDKELFTEKYCSSVDSLIEKVYKYELPTDTLRLLNGYYEIREDYASSEDYLFYLLEKTEYSKESINIGIDFYKRLQEIPEEKLAKGNLPIDEVISGLNQLMKMESL